MKPFRTISIVATLVCLAASVARGQEYSLPTRLKFLGFNAAFASFDEKATSLFCGFVSYDGEITIVVWDMSAGKETRRFDIHARAPLVHGGALSPDGKTIALGLRGYVGLFDARDGTKLRECEGSDLTGEGLIYLSRGQVLAGSVTGGGIQLWSTATGKRINRFAEKRGVARTLAVSSDSRWILAHHRVIEERLPLKHYLCLWEAETGKEIWSIPQTGKEVPVGFGSWGEFSWATGGLESGFRVRLSPTGTPFFTPGIGKLPIVVDIAHKESNLYDFDGAFIRDMIEANGSTVLSVQFSPLGKHVVLVGANWSRSTSEILVYDFPNWIASRGKSAGGDSETLWKDLASADDGKAHRALFTLRLMPKRDLLAFLKKRIPTIKAPDQAELDRWIRDLDSAVFTVRENAGANLKRQGWETTLTLQAAMKQPRNLEQKRRMESLVDQIKTEAIGGETPRGLRVLDLLEEHATPHAIDLVEMLARGTPGAWLTTESTASLRRMRK